MLEGKFILELSIEILRIGSIMYVNVFNAYANFSGLLFRVKQYLAEIMSYLVIQRAEGKKGYVFSNEPIYQSWISCGRRVCILSPAAVNGLTVQCITVRGFDLFDER